MLEENILKMNDSSKSGTGMDILIISTSTPEHARFWEKRLLSARGYLIKPDALIISVVEDWLFRAGNGLGTLYAYKKAREKAYDVFHIDIFEKQKEGASIAIYHTAGQGTRLSPLTASEYNIKPAVKLPGLVGHGSSTHLLTVLEAVIKQTSIYASSRRGRLSVFWGDQIFIPAKSCLYTPLYHIDIMAIMGKMPSKKQWEEQKLEHYGLLAVDSDGNAVDVDKADFDTISSLIEQEKIPIQGGVGKSLGNFSLSAQMTFALLEEFQEELSQKTEPMDSDPYFWMPTTLDEETYLMLMEKKKVSKHQARNHYKRMQAFKEKFIAQHKNLRYFGVLDTGEHGYWWDYGTLDAYYNNIIKLTADGQETTLMRLFFNLPLDLQEKSLDSLQVDGVSCVLNCQVKSGRIKNSILIGVQAEHLDIADSILINVSVKALQGDGCLLYNVYETEESSLSLDKGTIRADVFLPDHHQHIKLKTYKGRDGKTDWYVRLPWNHLSYEDLYQITMNIDLEKANAFAQHMYHHYS